MKLASIKTALATALLFSTSFAGAQEVDEPGELPSLEEIDRQLNNPLSKTWALTFQDNIGWSEYAGVFTTASALPQNTWYLQYTNDGGAEQIIFHYKVGGNWRNVNWFPPPENAVYVADLLRNEKPVYWVPEGKYLTTGQEVVGDDVEAQVSAEGRFPVVEVEHTRPMDGGERFREEIDVIDQPGFDVDRIPNPRSIGKCS